MQQLFFLFFITFLAAFLATLPPGLLNMNAAKTSVEKGKANGIMFGFGVSVTVMIQAYVSVRITKYLLRNSEVIELLLQIALIIFAVLALFFFVKARKQHSKPIEFDQSKKRGSFTKGVLLAAINILAIPYYSGLNTIFHKQNLMNYMVIDEVFFILASGLGTFLVMYMYAFYFNKMERKTNQFSKNSNYILSVLMAVLFVITATRLFNYA
jgi:threonine/homoserine/homoserine lactone efflux protein